MKYRNIIFIGLTIISIFFLVLSLILGDFFILFPFFFILPLSCGIRRRVEDTINVESNSHGSMDNYEDGQQIEEKSSKIDENKCPMCNNIISELNLRYCPHCGTRLKN